jgi:hypothetical protein
VSSRKVIILLSSDLMRHPDHLIEDLNPVERNDAKYHESYRGITKR